MKSLCLDVHGQAGGTNRGPFKDEAQYVAGPGNPPIAQGPADADIVWRYDMRNELGSFPRNQASSSVLVVGDKLFVTTSNGVDWSGKHVPSPDCPALICLDKNDGKLLAVERLGNQPPNLGLQLVEPRLRRDIGKANGRLRRGRRLLLRV